MPTAVSIRLPKELSQALDDLAASLDRPKTYLVRKALETYLAEYADYQIALDRLRDKDDAVLSSAELKKTLGL
ncbi:MAG: ribbon-helix-helix domain-containing protein [Proteobacteria bacterium]|nr:ribbon-helix-helix domain-containing protein [Pseudomonadota bacterium]